MFLLLSLVVCVILALFLWIKNNYNYWSNRGFQSAPTVFPFGSIKDAGRKITAAECVEGFYNDFRRKSPAVGVHFYLSPTLVAIDPELIKNILVRDFSSFHDRGIYFNKKDDPLTANLLTLEGAEWRERRAKLTPIFRYTLVS